ncbi:hypothetical protein [Azospirillum largimobile]
MASPARTRVTAAGLFPHPHRSCIDCGRVEGHAGKPSFGAPTLHRAAITRFSTVSWSSPAIVGSGAASVPFVALHTTIPVAGMVVAPPAGRQPRHLRHFVRSTAGRTAVLRHICSGDAGIVLE